MSQPSAQVLGSSRLASIDSLRGLIMAFMLVDHVREFFFLHRQVSDPMSLTGLDPALFFTRLASHLCAPLFVFLAGIGVWLYSAKPGRTRLQTSAYLLKRGAWLIFLELTFVNFAWSFRFPPQILYLQVIWAIGVSMLALAALLCLPRLWQALVCLALLAGHNLLDSIHFLNTDPGFLPWALLHDRAFIDLPWELKARSSYPVLPWIGLLLLGYLCGPLFKGGFPQKLRSQYLGLAGLLALALFMALRFFNRYGDHPWAPGNSSLSSAMAFLNLTKYPPSLDFVLFTLGLGCLGLAWLDNKVSHAPLVRLGSVPLFFYLLHLYVLHLLYLGALALFGPNQGTRFGFNEVWQLWALAALLLTALHGPCLWFHRLKARTSAWWTAYL